MDDVRGAEKHHPLGFKQHPNWKVLVTRLTLLRGQKSNHSFNHLLNPKDPCREYFHTFPIFHVVIFHQTHVGKYTSPMDPMGNGMILHVGRSRFFALKVLSFEEISPSHCRYWAPRHCRCDHGGLGNFCWIQCLRCLGPNPHVYSRMETAQ